MDKKKQLEAELERMRNIGNTAKVLRKHSLLMDVAVQLTQLRSNKGWTQRQLAKEAGVPQSTVARVESGEFGVGLSTIEKFLDVLDAEFKLVEKSNIESKKTPLRNINEVCEYILYKSKDILGESYDITNMKLNKLVYYLQVEYLKAYRKPFINNNFHAWQHGPIHKQVYNKYKGSKYKNNMIIEASEEKINLEKEDKDIIDKFLNKYAKLSAFELREKSHQESPWLDTKNVNELKMRLKTEYLSKRTINMNSDDWIDEYVEKSRNDIQPNNITLEQMYNYYSNNGEPTIFQ